MVSYLMQVLTQLPYTIKHLGDYKSVVEEVLPWHDKIHKMYKEFIVFSAAAQGDYPATHFAWHGKQLIAVHESVLAAYLCYLRSMT